MDYLQTPKSSSLSRTRSISSSAEGIFLWPRGRAAVKKKKKKEMPATYMVGNSALGGTDFVVGTESDSVGESSITLSNDVPCMRGMT